MIRIISKEPSVYYSTHSSNISTSNYLYVQTYDVETEQGSERPICKKFIDLQGLSQISLENILFLCGISTEVADEFSSSFVYSINILREPLTMNIEVNTCYPHYYPCLTILRNEYLVAIGGFKSIKCEYYSITNKKWKELPDLPEERYGASAICDNSYNIVYLFGGLNSKTNKCCMSILKLNMNNCLKWTTIVDIENSECLAKMNQALIKKDDGKVLIIGGVDSVGKRTEDIIEIDLKTKKFKPTILNIKLQRKPKFQSMRFAISNSAGFVYTLDDDEEGDMNIVHRIDDSFSSILYLDEANVKGNIFKGKASKL